MSDKRKTILFIAGEASGDTLGAELIAAIREQPGGDDIEFIGAGGPCFAKSIKVAHGS